MFKMEPMSLLNMLAEIATEKLQNDPAVLMIAKSEEQKRNKKERELLPVPETQFFQNQGKQMTLLQVSALSDNSLLRMFTVSQANELKRKFYFTCRFKPENCEKTFESFGNEDKAKNLMKKHLKSHLGELLEKHEDSRSRDSYILYTVGKNGRTANQCDSKSCSKKMYAKLESKSKTKVEKENSSFKSYKPKRNKVVSYSGPNSIAASTSVAFLNPTMEFERCRTTLNVTQSEMLNSDAYKPVLSRDAPISLGSPPSADKSTRDTIVAGHEANLNLNKTIFNDNGTIVTETSLESKLNKLESLALHCSTIKYNPVSSSQVKIENMTSNQNSNSFSTAAEGAIASTPQNTSLSTPQSPNVLASAPPNAFPPPAHNFLSATGVFQSCLQSETDMLTPSSPKRQCEVRDDAAQGELKKMTADIIDIKGEECIKMELLDSGPQIEVTASNISHDHGYIGVKGPLIHGKVVQEALVNSSEREHDVGKSEQIESGLAESQTLSEIVQTESDLKEIDDYVEGDLDAEEAKKCLLKVRAKESRRRKVLGQSKDERERALLFIEKIKSQQPMTLMTNLECSICTPPRVFTAPSTLLSHYRSHAGIRPYNCPLCEAVFTRQHSLNYHLLIHSNRTRFTCDDCGRKFRHPSHFKEHLRKHTGESPYECVDCFTRFKTRNTYKRHLRTRHDKKLTTEGSVYSLSDDRSPEHLTKTKLNIKALKAHDDTVLNDSSPSSKEISHNTELSSDSGPHNVFCGSEGTQLVTAETLISVREVVMSTSESISQKSEDSGVKKYHEMMPLDNAPFLGNCSGFPTSETDWKRTEHDSKIATTAPYCTKGDFVAPYLEQQSRSAPGLSCTSSSGVYFFLNGNSSNRPIYSVASHSLVPMSTNAVVFRTSSSKLQTEHGSFVKDSGTVNVQGPNNELGVSAVANHAKLSQAFLPEINTHQAISSPSFIALNHSTANYRQDKTTLVMPNVDTSILSSLLTTDSVGKYQTCEAPGAISNVKQEREAEVTSLLEREVASSSTDKWDTLMHEVVSLSTAVKEKDTRLEPCLSGSNLVPCNILIAHQPLVRGKADTPMKELSSNVELTRSRDKEAKDLYVLKYVSSSSGSRVAKVFKAKPSVTSKEPSVGSNRPNSSSFFDASKDSLSSNHSSNGGSIGVLNGAVKPILITSSVQHFRKPLHQSAPSDSVRAII